MCATRIGMALWLLLGGSVALAGAPEPLPRQRFVVVIDPGHGGRNQGCRTSDGRVPEKTVTLAIAHELRAELVRRLPHAEVVLTRSGDETLPLGERTAVANAHGADLLLSIHANASPQADQRGFETYVLHHGVFELDAVRLARRAGESSGGAVEGLLEDLELQAQRNRAIRAAELIQGGQADQFPRRLDRGVKAAAFDVLIGARSPAVLVEVGFLDHADEGPLLVDAAGRSLISRGLANSVVDYYRDATQRGWLRPWEKASTAPSASGS